jgi:hypothetical protein
MKNEFVTYEIALRMKSLGFDRPCFAFYQIEYNEDIPVMVDDDNQYRISGFRTCKNSEIPAHYTTTPTWQSAFKWFREEYNLKGHVEPVEYLDGTPDTYHWSIFNNCNSGNDQLTYEEAQQSCLEKLCEIVENIKK